MWTLVLPIFRKNRAAKKSGKKQNTNDSLDSDDFVQVQFQTPCKTFVEEIKTAEKIRDLMYVLDEELQPLSPTFHGQQQKAPQKSQTTLQRTTQWKVLV
jgi:hypothetical protein